MALHPPIGPLKPTLDGSPYGDGRLGTYQSMADDLIPALSRVVFYTYHPTDRIVHNMAITDRIVHNMASVAPVLEH